MWTYTGACGGAHMRMKACDVRQLCFETVSHSQTWNHQISPWKPAVLTFPGWDTKCATAPSFSRSCGRSRRPSCLHGKPFTYWATSPSSTRNLRVIRLKVTRVWLSFLVYQHMNFIYVLMQTADSPFKNYWTPWNGIEQQKGQFVFPFFFFFLEKLTLFLCICV